MYLTKSVKNMSRSYFTKETEKYIIYTVSAEIIKRPYQIFIYSAIRDVFQPSVCDTVIKRGYHIRKFVFNFP